MNLVNKSFVYYKYLSYLRSNEFLFVFRNNYDNSKYGVQEIQKNLKQNFIKRAVRNKLLKIILLDSLLSSFLNVISAKIGLIPRKRIDLVNFKNILNNNVLFGLKFENKFYLKDQLYSITSLNYIIIIKLYNFKFNSLLNVFFKLLKKNTKF